ncbi:MAG: hypothetical protein QOK31_466 [Solirubrobacteraceae bacterium]|jgi:subtilisin family serine protease|nr:hypothetical protein [Solirubrobacteraceae bacterium]
MSRRTCLPALLAAVTGLSVAPVAVAKPGREPVIVVLRGGSMALDRHVARLMRAAGVTPKLRYRAALDGFSASVTEGQLRRLRHDPEVAFVTPDAKVTATGTPVAPGETVPAGIRRIGAVTTTEAHGASTSAVAVLDTGVALTQPDLNVVSGTNCIKPGTTAADDNGHGTHVAGTIAARNNGSGVVGVSPGTRVYAVKVLGSNRSGTLSQLLCGINWVAANAATLNIKVANMSISGAGGNDNNCGNTNKDAEHKAICAAVSTGVSFVVSAGNNATNFSTSVPAAYPEVLTATATTDTDGSPGGHGAVPTCKKGETDDSYGTYSNYAVAAADQAHVVAAPGTCVISDSRTTGTATYYGTSQAAPHVAGAVALCLGSSGVSGPCDGLSPAQIISRIRADAAAAGTLSNGFRGDPLRPLTGRYFGYLVAAAAY